MEGKWGRHTYMWRSHLGRNQNIEIWQKLVNQAKLNNESREMKNQVRQVSQKC